LTQLIPIWKGQMEKICNIPEIAYRMKRSNWQNLWHAWNYVTIWRGQMAKICDMHKFTHVFRGQMAKVCNMHKFTHAFEFGKHVNIMGPNKWNQNYELQSTCRWNYKADENEMKITTRKLKTKHLKVVDIWMHEDYMEETQRWMKLWQ
jgi:hypothetical protein